MALADVDCFVFVPYISNVQNRKAREKQLSAVRSHVGRRSRQEVISQKSQLTKYRHERERRSRVKRVPIEPPELLPKRHNEWHHVPACTSVDLPGVSVPGPTNDLGGVDGSPNTTQATDEDVGEEVYVDRSSTSGIAALEPHHSLTRARDRCFGSFGPSCRQIEALEMRAIEHSMTRSISLSLVRDKKFLHRYRRCLGGMRNLLTLLGGTLHRALSDDSILDSYLAATFFWMAEDAGDGSLRVAGAKTSRRALRSLRRTPVDFRAAVSANTYVAIVHSSLAAALAGDFQATAMHLRFLARTAQGAGSV